MVAAAVVVSLQLQPGRWDPVWYGVGFMFSVPIALMKSFGDPQQGQFATFGMLASSLAYILACVFPAKIPSVLGDLAVRLLV